MEERPDHLPDFNDPPLREVAVGVHFEMLHELRQAHLGLFWERVRSSYPITEDREALPEHVETLDGQAGPAFRFVVSDSPPLHRAWFISADETSLIQLQADRLFHNWRHQGGKYPHFESLLASFRGAYDKFSTMIDELNVPPPQRTHSEVTYVNVIEAPSLDRVLRGYASLPSGTRGVGPTSDRESLMLRYPVFTDDLLVGRLYVEATPTMQSTPMGLTPAYRLVLTFRAPHNRGRDLAGDLGILQRGREAIVEVFTALTSDDDHVRWGRIK